MENHKVKFYISVGGKHYHSFERINFALYRFNKCKSKLIICDQVGQNPFKLCIPTKHSSLFYYIIVSIRVCGFDSNLFAIFDDSSECVVISEQITVANSFCFSNFLSICGNDLIMNGTEEQLCIAYSMRNNFIFTDGRISSVIISNPNGLETNSYPLFNFLSNILYYCIIDVNLYSSFLGLTNSKSLIQGILNIAQNPFLNVDQIYSLFENINPIFVPSLNKITVPVWKTIKPDQWTLTIKINNSGSGNFLIGGPGYVVFDKDNKVWLNNNTRQGTANSSTFCTILEPNGQPVPFSPLFGGGLLGAGFGIAASKNKDKIAIGNFGWGPIDYNPQCGSVSVIKSNGKIITPPNGWTNGFNRAQGVYYDRHDNLWISAWGNQNPLGGGGSNTFDFKGSNSAIVVYIKGNPCNFSVYQFDSEFHNTFDVVIDDDDNVFVSNAGNVSENVKSSVYHFRLINCQIVKINSWISDHVETSGIEAFRQINLNPCDDCVYVAAVISSRIIKLNKQLIPVGEFTTNIDGPWGVTFDNCGTMFVSNFRRDTHVVNNHTFDMAGKFGITVVYGGDDSTAKIVTLPTGGNQIMLYNGFPLYGSNSKPSYEPLMRVTGSNIDINGNLWSVNNWKPSLINDFLSNPGGDGAVVFIGLAKPKY